MFSSHLTKKQKKKTLVSVVNIKAQIIGAVGFEMAELDGALIIPKGQLGKGSNSILPPIKR